MCAFLRDNALGLVLCFSKFSMYCTMINSTRFAIWHTRTHMSRWWSGRRWSFRTWNFVPHDGVPNALLTLEEWLHVA